MSSLTTEGNENEEKDFNDEGALSHRDLTYVLYYENKSDTVLHEKE